MGGGVLSSGTRTMLQSPVARAGGQGRKADGQVHTQAVWRAARNRQPGSQPGRGLLPGLVCTRQAVAPTWSLRLRPVCSLPPTAPTSSLRRRSLAVWMSSSPLLTSNAPAAHSSPTLPRQRGGCSSRCRGRAARRCGRLEKLNPGWGSRPLCVSARVTVPGSPAAQRLPVSTQPRHWCPAPPAHLLSPSTIVAASSSVSTPAFASALA